VAVDRRVRQCGRGDSPTAFDPRTQATAWIAGKRDYSTADRVGAQIAVFGAEIHPDLKRLPDGIYNTNRIRQYARAIGFDETDPPD
jgi:hypothetical protein